MSRLARVAARAAIPPFYVMEVARAAGERERAGHEVFHLEVGQPSTGLPERARAAVQEAMAAGPLGYTDAEGTPALRRRIARHYRERHGVEVPVERIVVTTGASAAFTLAFLASFDAGDRVAAAAPGYPCYRNALSAFGVENVTLAVGEDTRFHPTPTMLAAAGRLAGLVVASPSNPTGTALRAAELEALAEYCESERVQLVVDEIYQEITYGRTAPTALAISEDAIVINSFSKYWSMTGWRVGWLVAPPELVGPIERLAQNLMLAPPTVGQVAALAAMDCDEELAGHVARYASNREVLLTGLPAAGMSRLAPADGAFYAWADVSGFGLDSQELARRWLDDTGVAATPGIDFDPVRGRDWMRFSFAGTGADMSEAMTRLAAWADRHHPPLTA